MDLQPRHCGNTVYIRRLGRRMRGVVERGDTWCCELVDDEVEMGERGLMYQKVYETQ